MNKYCVLCELCACARVYASAHTRHICTFSAQMISDGYRQANLRNGLWPICEIEKALWSISKFTMYLVWIIVFMFRSRWMWPQSREFNFLFNLSLAEISQLWTLHLAKVEEHLPVNAVSLLVAYLWSWQFEEESGHKKTTAIKFESVFKFLVSRLSVVVHFEVGQTKLPCMKYCMK